MPAIAPPDNPALYFPEPDMQGRWIPRQTFNGPLPWQGDAAPAAAAPVMPQQDTAPTAAYSPLDPETVKFDQGLAKSFQEDWDRAQQRFTAGVKAGYTEQDASQMYLDPVKQRWTLAAANLAKERSDLTGDPIGQENRGAITKLLDEGQHAEELFHAGIKAGYTPEDSAAMHLSPFQQKWTAHAALPTPAKPHRITQAEEDRYYANNKAMQDEAAALRTELKADPTSIEPYNRHPVLLEHRPWRGMFYPGYEKAVSATTRALKVPDIASLGTKRKTVQTLLENADSEPPATKQAYKREISRIDEILASGVASPEELSQVGVAPTESDIEDQPQTGEDAAAGDTEQPAIQMPLATNVPQRTFQPPASAPIKIGRFTVTPH
jgi:hypothetical protein